MATPVCWFTPPPNPSQEGKFYRRMHLPGGGGFIGGCTSQEGRFCCQHLSTDLPHPLPPPRMGSFIGGCPSQEGRFYRRMPLPGGEVLSAEAHPKRGGIVGNTCLLVYPPPTPSQEGRFCWQYLSAGLPHPRPLPGGEGLLADAPPQEGWNCRQYLSIVYPTPDPHPGGEVLSATPAYCLPTPRPRPGGEVYWR